MVSDFLSAAAATSIPTLDANYRLRPFAEAEFRDVDQVAVRCVFRKIRINGPIPGLNEVFGKPGSRPTEVKGATDNAERAIRQA